MAKKTDEPKDDSALCQAGADYAAALSAYTDAKMACDAACEEYKAAEAQRHTELDGLRDALAKATQALTDAAVAANPQEPAKETSK